ncbi:hypothetical protein IMG5_120530, partial [Ichthyophthirius multifiliis]
IMIKDKLNLQTNLRASHFTLGNDQKHLQYQTIHRKDYTPKKAQHEQSQDLKLMNSHFALGEEKKQWIYNTTNNVAYPFHKGTHKAGLEEARQRDLRTHHFQFGSYGPTVHTHNNLTYDTKPVQQNLQNEREAQKAKMRRHNHQFAESERIEMTSNYNDQYNKQLDPNALRQGLSAADIMQKVVNLRNSHIVFGKENLPMKTIQQSDYTRKPEAKIEQKNPALQQSHFELGNQKNTFTTTNREFHNEQPLVQNRLAEETQKDLRASHFMLGQDQQQYNTEFTGNFKNHQLNGFKKINLDEKFFKNNFTHTNPDGKTNYNSTYKTYMKFPETAKLEPSREQNMDRRSNFQLGQQANQWKTEFQDQYFKNNGKPSILQQDQKDNLRKSHFQFEDMKNGQYSTEQKSQFTNKNINQARGVLDPQLQKDLRTHHFEFGAQKGLYETTHKKHYVKYDNYQKAQFNYQKAMDLRADHFQVN